jgi:hypothetical protein
MANVEISQLIQALRDVNPTDLFEIQDPLDLSQGPSGTSKYVTGAEIFGAIPTPVPINAILPMAYNGLTGDLSVGLSATAPINYTVGSFTFAHNITNLKITANELNTIQDISTSSTPTFVNVSFSSFPFGSQDRIFICGGGNTVTSSTNFRYSPSLNNLIAGSTNSIDGVASYGAILGGDNNTINTENSGLIAGSSFCTTMSGSFDSIISSSACIVNGTCNNTSIFSSINSAVFNCDRSVIIGSEDAGSKSTNGAIIGSVNSSTEVGISQVIFGSVDCNISVSCDNSSVISSSLSGMSANCDRSVVIGSSSCSISSANNSIVLGSLDSINSSSKGAIIGTSSSTTAVGLAQVIIGSDQCSIGAGSDYASIISSVSSAIGSNCDGSVVIGGTGNQISTGSTYSGILFGSLNNVTGSRSSASGHKAKSLHNGTFMIQCDNTAASDFTSTLDGTFCVKALNGIGLGTASPNSSVSLSGTISTQRAATNITTATAVLRSNIIGCTASGITIILSTSDLVNGRNYIIKDESGAATLNPITINAIAPALIDGQASTTISINYGSVKVYSNGVNWFTI